jgi:hypothetical protein
MRTKTLLLVAAVFTAGLGASKAQTVYSVNAVGYVNVGLVAGFNLIANPLNGTNNNLNTIIPVALGDSLAFRWNAAAQGFAQADTYFDVNDPLLNGWYDGGTGLKTTTTIAPGEGFFISSPGSTTITFVGEVPQGNLTNPVPALFSFKSSVVPQSVGIVSVGFPGVNDMLYYSWNPAAQGYNQALTYFDVNDPAVNGFYDGATKVDPTPAVGQGFLIYNPGPQLSWGRTFSVN